ncbi:hypothetical protein B5M43_012225 [Microbacterium sp. MEC084]|jgi:hypothetical protein|uniref:hypothetical protein n=1 Tax=unclassified Microbacterium TaxID=2609290 RepID=UPI0006F5A509|nr:MULTISPECIES: hypothetical protein [unclassified Microbacterium]KQY98499.1 hypothetical protein ASD19_06565 [Microbacterium sp. Root53]MCD1269591.1 hypothetical protein [Microbacterium sp. MEC084]
MRILQKLVLDIDADAAWRALHSPAALAELYGPLLRVEAMAADGLPVRWEHGSDAPVRYSTAGLGLGAHLISMRDRTKTDANGPVRILRDAGIPLTGPLAGLDAWDHQMAVAPLPGDPSRTLWRERLVIRGAVAPLLWPALWAVWQWRGARLKRLAPTWAYDGEPVEPDAADE